MDTSPVPPVRLLLVDDSAGWRKAIGSILQRHLRRHVISEARDGMEAVDQASALRPDLILLDLNLPRLNGIAACKQILRCSPRSRILFVSQQTDPDFVHAAYANGALGYVAKARVQSDLLPAIEALLPPE